jgi:hypothetical protein
MNIEKTDEWVIVDNYSSSTTYTSNRSNHFTNKIAGIVNTPGEWEIAIESITYPHNWLNLAFKEDIYIFVKRPYEEYESTELRYDNPKKDEVIDVFLRLFGINEPLQLYKEGNLSPIRYKSTKITYVLNPETSIEDFCKRLVENIKSEFKELAKLKIQQDPSTHKLKFYTDIEFIMLSKMGLFLKTIGLIGKDLYATGYQHVVVKNSLLCDLLPDIERIPSLYVCSDLVEESYVGDKSMNLLGIIPIAHTPGRNNMFTFRRKLFKRLKKKDISEFDIDLKTPDGNAFPIESGFVNVSLILRQKSI